ncbi:hypothetical protein [Spirosoma arcticum]
MIFAVLTLLVSVVMVRYKPTVQPPIPAKQPMLDFQFATSADAVNALFIDPRTGKPVTAYVDKMRSLNQIDFLYIALYTAFSFSFAQQANQAYPSVWGQIALFVAFVPGVFDVLENIQLLSILKSVEQGPNTNYEPALTRLARFTWIKWITIGWLPILLLPFLWHQGLPSKLLGLLAIVVATAGVVALLNRRRVPVPAAYVTLVFAVSALLSVYAIVRCLVLYANPLTAWL